MIYITDYIEDPDLERAIVGDCLRSFSGDGEDRLCAEVLLVWHFKVNEVSLADFPKVKAIVRYGVGFDNIDLDLCKSRGIKVFNNPDYGVDEVSDTALAMIMNFSRCINAYNNKSRELLSNPDSLKPWQENTNKNALRLKDATLGLVGVGRIGSALALKMKNIIGNISFYDPYVVAGYEKVLGANRYDSLKGLLECSDIVSVHTPLGTETKGLINDSFVNSMKRGCILINSARGGILSSKACIYNGLKSGRIGAVGLDVLPEEPPLLDAKDEFLSSWLDINNEFSDRIIINPHTAYYSPQSFEEMRGKAATMALKALQDQQIQNRII